MRSALGACLAALFLSAAPRTSPSLVAERPRKNVIIILADDLGYGDLGCYGHPKFKTPNIDRLAAEGARLTAFTAPVPYCAPSRASLLTGRYPFRCGMTRNPVPKEDPLEKTLDGVGLPLDELTLGDLFRKRGYKTACYGKWHLGHQPQFRPTRRGFDSYFGILYSNDMHRVELIENNKVVEYPVVQTTVTKRLTAKAVDFIQANRNRPFLLYLPHIAPHKPLAPGEEFYAKSSAGIYGDVISEVDWSVGQITSKLKELGLEKDTLVVFTSDNGPWYGGSTGGLRGMKLQSWEGGIRVPLIARLPGVIAAGHVSGEPAVMPDIFPTALEVAGIPPPKDRVIDGKSLMPVLTLGAKSPHEAVFSFRGENLTGVRAGRWKLYVGAPGPTVERDWKPNEKYTDPRGPDGVRILAPFEQAHPSQFPGVATGDTVITLPALFDLESDAAEQRNIAASHPEVVRRLSDMAERMRGEMRMPRTPSGDGGLTLVRDGHWLIIKGAKLPGEISINYLEAYCRAGSTDADWVKQTVIPHSNAHVLMSADSKVLKLKDTLADGVTVEHTINAGQDEVDFRLVAHHPRSVRSEAHWAQPCVRLSAFMGFDEKARARVEALQWQVAARALEIGIDVVLDFGFWSRAEREEFRSRAKALGADAEVVFLDVSREELVARLAARCANLPEGTFPVTEAQVDDYLAVFEPPGEEERTDS